MIPRRRTMEDFLAEVDDDDEAAGSANRTPGRHGTRGARRRLPSNPVATAERARRQARVAAVVLSVMFGVVVWWNVAQQDDPLPWVPTESQCETYLALDDDGRSDWIDRSIDASWPQVRGELTVQELRSVMRFGFATCDD